MRTLPQSQRIFQTRSLFLECCSYVIGAFRSCCLFCFVNTQGWFPSPFFPIYIDNIHKDKHGSDSGTYDTEGRYSPANLEFIFSKYARTYPDKLSFGEIWNMTEGNRVAFDFFGWSVVHGRMDISFILANMVGIEG